MLMWLKCIVSKAEGCTEVVSESNVEKFPEVSSILYQTTILEHLLWVPHLIILHPRGSLHSLSLVELMLSLLLCSYFPDIYFRRGEAEKEVHK